MNRKVVNKFLDQDKKIFEIKSDISRINEKVNLLIYDPTKTDRYAKENERLKTQIKQFSQDVDVKYFQIQDLTIDLGKANKIIENLRDTLKNQQEEQDKSIKTLEEMVDRRETCIQTLENDIKALKLEHFHDPIIVPTLQKMAKEVMKERELKKKYFEANKLLVEQDAKLKADNMMFRTRLTNLQDLNHELSAQYDQEKARAHKMWQENEANKARVLKEGPGGNEIVISKPLYEELVQANMRYNTIRSKLKMALTEE